MAGTPRLRYVIGGGEPVPGVKRSKPWEGVIVVRLTFPGVVAKNVGEAKQLILTEVGKRMQSYRIKALAQVGIGKDVSGKIQAEVDGAEPLDLALELTDEE